MEDDIDDLLNEAESKFCGNSKAGAEKINATSRAKTLNSSKKKTTPKK